MTNEKLLKKFEDAVSEKNIDEMFESADPNRESADYARKKLKRIKKQVLKRMMV